MARKIQPPRPTTLTIPQILPMYQRSLEAEVKAPGTVSTYLQAVGVFAAWRTREGLTDQLAAITPDEMRGWLIAMRADGRKAGTVASYYAGMKRFFGWCLAEDLLTSSPLANVKRPVTSEEEVRILTDAELAALFKTCATRSFLDLRDLAMMRILVDTGLRVSELCAICLDHVDLKSHTIRIPHGKGDTWRYCPYGAKAAKALDRFLLARAVYAEDHQQLLTSPLLWFGQRGRLTRDGVQQMLHRRSVAAGIVPVHPHLFRHTFIDRMNRTEMRDQHIRAITGHKSSKVFEKYSQKLRTERALAEYRSMPSPGDGI